MNVELPATVRQYAEASGWLEQSVRRFIRKRLLRVDESCKPLLIVGGSVPPPSQPEPQRCPFTIDMFEGAAA